MHRSPAQALRGLGSAERGVGLEPPALSTLPVTLAKLPQVRPTGRLAPCLMDAVQLPEASMSQRTIRSGLTLFVLALIIATVALAQSSTSLGVSANATRYTWQGAQLAGSSKSRLFVVTLDQPHRRQTCRVQSFTMDRLVCSRAIGSPRTYLPQQVVALILPGDRDLKLRLTLWLNGGLAAAIWGTVALAGPCPACAVATGIVALMLFAAAGAVLIGEDRPDQLLYLAPGQQLTGKLRFLQP